MDPADAFYQEMDSQDLLDRHGAALVADAQEVLATEPMARVAGLITMPDSRDAGPLRQTLEKVTGQPVPAGLMVGLVPRQSVESLLLAQPYFDGWREESWQEQRVLAVVVSTRDGFKFGFFGLGDREKGAHGDA